MQAAGICYRKFSEDRREELGAGPEYGRDPVIVLHQFQAQFGGTLGWRAICRRSAALVDGGFQCRHKSLARTTAIDMVFQFFAEGIVKLLVEIIRQLCEHRLAAGWS